MTIAKLQFRPSSTYFHIPKVIVEQLELAECKEVKLIMKDGLLIVEPVRPTKENK